MALTDKSVVQAVGFLKGKGEQLEGRREVALGNYMHNSAVKTNTVVTTEEEKCDRARGEKRPCAH